MAFISANTTPIPSYNGEVQEVGYSGAVSANPDIRGNNDDSETEATPTPAPVSSPVKTQAQAQQQTQVNQQTQVHQQAQIQQQPVKPQAVPNVNTTNMTKTTTPITAKQSEKFPGDGLAPTSAQRPTTERAWKTGNATPRMQTTTSTPQLKDFNFNTNRTTQPTQPTQHTQTTQTTQNNSPSKYLKLNENGAVETRNILTAQKVIDGINYLGDKVFGGKHLSSSAEEFIKNLSSPTSAIGQGIIGPSKSLHSVGSKAWNSGETVQNLVDEYRARETSDALFSKAVTKQQLTLDTLEQEIYNKSKAWKNIK